MCQLKNQYIVFLAEKDRGVYAVVPFGIDFQGIPFFRL